MDIERKWNRSKDNITIEKAGILIENLGQGEKIFINIEFLLANSSEDSNIILIEEPENHLIYLNMHKLINKIITTDQKNKHLLQHIAI